MTMKMTWRSTVVVAIAAAFVSGCLQKEERHIWYLDAATGSVSWVVFEHDVRSDETDSAKRLAEEADYRRKVLSETHDAARGLRALGGANVRTLVVRSEVPFSIVTDANFPSIDELGRRFLAQFKAVGTSVLKRDGQSFIWTMKVREEDDPPDQASDDDEDWFVGNLFESLRVVLPSGHFESTVGFTLDQKGRVATIDKEQFDDVDENTEAVLSLRWTPAPS
jgi:hypothetical protein